jgi:hypothetical protein
MNKIEKFISNKNSTQIWTNNESNKKKKKNWNTFFVLLK